MPFIFPNPTPILPQLPGWSFSVHKRPTWATLEFVAISGRRVSSPQQAYPLWEFELTYDMLRDQTQNYIPYQRYAGRQEFTQLSELFLACAGKYGQFYFDDPTDNSRNGQQIGIGDGITTQFLALRNWGYGNLATPEPVGGINTLETIYFNGSPVASNTYSFSGNIITFISAPPPGTIITIDFHFYYLCQFLEDQHDYEQFMFSLWQMRTLKMRSVKQ